MIEFNSIIVFKLIGMITLYLFLPFTAITYYFTRRRRREIEIERLLSILKIDSVHKKPYEVEKRISCYLWAIFYASVVSGIGLTLLFLSTEIGFENGEFPMIKLSGEVTFPQIGSRLVFSMAFLGAYLWGLQHIFRRYSLNDLSPSLYYGFSIRMILASVIALVVYNGCTALTGSNDSSNGITANIWPTLAFLLGIFPQRGLRWLTDRLPILSSGTNDSVKIAPLEMIEGIEFHDSLRLEELGIDSCYDLANADFVPLILKTPYSARQLIDWILQAKLCLYFGEATKDLRHHGIRTIIDLEHLTHQAIDTLATETAVTKFTLEQAWKSVKEDIEIKRLYEIGILLGKFWKSESNNQI